MRSYYNAFLIRWQACLHLKRQTNRSWHITRLREERIELQEETAYIAKISEEADIIFVILRASCNGHYIEELPQITTVRHELIHSYMLGKYTSRCLFYRTIGIICRRSMRDTVSEVVNPKKDFKLEAVGVRHNIDPILFRRVGSWLRMVWPLLL